jgi:hypothetical protein
MTMVFLMSAGCVSVATTILSDKFAKRDRKELAYAWNLIGYSTASLIVLGGMGVLVTPTDAHWTEALSKVLGLATLFIATVLVAGMVLLYRSIKP